MCLRCEQVKDEAPPVFVDCVEKCDICTSDTIGASFVVIPASVILSRIL